MNYLFISPEYPISCTLFIDRLNSLGVRVLGKAAIRLHPVHSYSSCPALPSETPITALTYSFV